MDFIYIILFSITDLIIQQIKIFCKVITRKMKNKFFIRKPKDFHFFVLTVKLVLGWKYEGRRKH